MLGWEWEVPSISLCEPNQSRRSSMETGGLASQSVLEAGEFASRTARTTIFAEETAWIQRVIFRLAVLKESLGHPCRLQLVKHRGDEYAVRR